MHPHIGDACHEAKVNEVTIQLLSDNPYPKKLPTREPLNLAIGSVRAKYTEIMSKKGIPLSAVESLNITFVFYEHHTDNYTCSVKSILQTASGKTYEQKIL